jgi:methionine synthase I (cobalamin-dependent)
LGSILKELEGKSVNKIIKFLDRMDASDIPLLADGAMGTMLNSRGIGFNQCFDALNVSAADLVAGIHRAYIEAGAEIIETNTFGANRYKLAAHDLATVTEINRAGVRRHGRQARHKERNLHCWRCWTLGAAGSRAGETEQARRVFSEQIAAQVAEGVDLIILETFSDLAEIEQAIAAARSVCDLPITASLTYTRDDRTMMGDSPEAAAESLQAAGVDVIGVNCSGGPEQIWRILRLMRSRPARFPSCRMLAGRSRPEAGFATRPNPNTSGITPWHSRKPGLASSVAAAGRPQSTSRPCARRWTARWKKLAGAMGSFPSRKQNLPRKQPNCPPNWLDSWLRTGL